jgi:hypothetical protein
MFTRSVVMTIIVDLVILGELTYAMYVSHTKGEEMTIYFLKLFLPMAVATWVVAKWVRKGLGAKGSVSVHN